MRVGLGHMQIRPSDFWEYTLSEWLFAIEGYRMKNGGGEPDPMTRGELDRMMKEYPDEHRHAS